jgi:hypothetical protein
MNNKNLGETWKVQDLSPFYLNYLIFESIYINLNSNKYRHS